MNVSSNRVLGRVLGISTVRNYYLPASSLLLSFKTGSYIFVDASPGASNISKVIFYIK